VAICRYGDHDSVSKVGSEGRMLTELVKEDRRRRGLESIV
jgi:hypothetical protein